MKTVTLDVKVADLPKMQQFMAATGALIRALAECDDLPQPVMDAADQIRRVAADLGGRDIGPPP